MRFDGFGLRSGGRRGRLELSTGRRRCWKHYPRPCDGDEYLGIEVRNVGADERGVGLVRRGAASEHRPADHRRHGDRRPDSQRHDWSLGRDDPDRIRLPMATLRLDGILVCRRRRAHKFDVRARRCRRRLDATGQGLGHERPRRRHGDVTPHRDRLRRPGASREHVVAEDLGQRIRGLSSSCGRGNLGGKHADHVLVQWRRCDGGGGNCVSVAGATSAEYSVVYADGGSTLRVLITAANDFGSAASQSSPTQVVSKPSVYWGAYIDGDPTYDYYYGGSWGDAPWDAEAWARFESNAGKKVSIVHWGLRTPWAHDFKYFLGPFNLVHQAGDLNLVDMTTASVPLRDVANGAYDPELKTWFQQAAAWGHPFFLALDIEMNGPWEPYAPGVNGNTAPDFVAMWRHVHDLATAAGAGNVTWTWCPNIDNGNKFTPYEKLYPGDAYVDWTCLHGYNKTGNDSFSSVFTTSYQKLLTLAPTKPIMIGETGAVEGGLGKAAWIKDALVTQLPRYFPRVKALVWFNWRILEDGKWWEWPIESSASAQDAFRSAIGSSYYAAGGGFNNLPAGSKVQEP